MTRRADSEELLARWDELRQLGREVSAEQLADDAPELVTELRRQIESLKAMDWLDRPAGEVVEPAEGPATRGVAVPPIVGGRYRLERIIAEGGFGQVWRATDTALERAVAVKVTTLECVREARRVARLRHHGIVAVHDVGNEAGLCYIVFDLVEGTDLARRIADRPFLPDEAAWLVAEVAALVHYAHEKGFVHRDIKPANILLDESGKPVLADFGIAVTECELRAEALTSTGTLAYMAPEQLRAGGRVDARTDVYGLGVVLYELMTGKVPFADSTLTGLRRRILGETPRPIRTLNEAVPAELEQICMKCLSKAAIDRYGSARELAQALTTFLNAT